MTDETYECKKHPCAPHGYDRNGSHSEDRYVCTCEYWTPPRECRGEELLEVITETQEHLRYLIEYCTSIGVLHPERGFTWPDGEQWSVQIYKDMLGDKYKPYFKRLPP